MHHDCMMQLALAIWNMNWYLILLELQTSMIISDNLVTSSWLTAADWQQRSIAATVTVTVSEWHCHGTSDSVKVTHWQLGSKQPTPGLAGRPCHYTWRLELRTWNLTSKLLALAMSGILGISKAGGGGGGRILAYFANESCLHKLHVSCIFCNFVFAYAMETDSRGFCIVMHIFAYFAYFICIFFFIFTCAFSNIYCILWHICVYLCIF